MRSGASCSNEGNPGFACSPSSCSDGILTLGICAGAPPFFVLSRASVIAVCVCLLQHFATHRNPFRMRQTLATVLRNCHRGSHARKRTQYQAVICARRPIVLTESSLLEDAQVCSAAHPSPFCGPHSENFYKLASSLRCIGHSTKCNEPGELFVGVGLGQSLHKHSYSGILLLCVKVPRRCSHRRALHAARF